MQPTREKFYEKTGAQAAKTPKPLELRNRIEIWENEQGGGDDTRPMAKLNILVVENDIDVGNLLAEVLVLMGHKVCAVVTTEANAIAAAERCRPELMIVDVWLDEGNGISAVDEALRTQYVPHLFVTGDGLRIKALRPQAVILQKPFGQVDLARAIRRALSSMPPTAT